MMRKMICMGLVMGMAVSASATPFVFESIGQTYTENFNSYRGNTNTLPNNLFVDWDTSQSGMDDPNAPFQGVNTGAFTAYTSDDADHSFGIRERNPENLRDARLYFEFTNNTGEDIFGFNVSYDVEAWYVGDRRNRIRLKYDDQLGANRFEEDIFSTDNPSTTTAFRTNVDGSLADNRTTVSGYVDLTTYLDPDGDPFGPLAPGATAYFRWQFSNIEVGEGSGSHRSGLAINNLSIQAIPEPGTVGLLAAASAFIMYLRRKVFIA